MAKSKIRINPVTMEIEIEVSDAFLEKYFRKLTHRFSKAKKAVPEIKSIKTKDAAPKGRKVSKKTKAAEKPKARKGKPKAKRLASEQAVLAAIKKGRDSGIAAAQVVEATGLEKGLVRDKIHRLKAKGLIATAGRGKYLGIEFAEGEAWLHHPDMEE